MTQLSLLDALRNPPIIHPIMPHGDVVHGQVDDSFVLPHPRFAWPVAQIDLHRHSDGTWMWGVNFTADSHGGDYRVGPKWGKFASSRDDALYYAACEMRSQLERDRSSSAVKIRAWLGSIVPEAT